MAAGVAAMYLQQYSTESPLLVKNAVTEGATENVLSSIGTGSPNLLLYSSIPSAVEANIDGPSTVHPEDWCQWTADVEAGHSPFTYQWSGIASGTGSSISFTPTSAGTLTLKVWDALGTNSSTSMWITVDYGLSEPVCGA